MVSKHSGLTQEKYWEKGGMNTAIRCTNATIQSILKKIYITSEICVQTWQPLDVKCGGLVQCHFDYSETSWYICLTHNLKHKLQTVLNHC